MGQICPLIFTHFRTLSPGLENHGTLKCIFDSFPGPLKYLLFLENCWNSTPRCTFSPIQGEKSWLVLNIQLGYETVTYTYCIDHGHTTIQNSLWSCKILWPLCPVACCQPVIAYPVSTLHHWMTHWRELLLMGNTCYCHCVSWYIGWIKLQLLLYAKYHIKDN